MNFVLDNFEFCYTNIKTLFIQEYDFLYLTVFLTNNYVHYKLFTKKHVDNANLKFKMTNKTESRKQFLKRFGFGLFSEEDTTALNEETEIVSLDEEQLEFLVEYETWLKEFHTYVKKRNLEPFNVENNKRLMELSAEAEQRKQKLETYMEDILFSTVFNKITEAVSKEI